VVTTGSQANVAATSTVFLDLWNATGSGVVVRVLGLYIIPSLTAVTGVGMTWQIGRTSAIGTGGTASTPRPYDTTNGTLNASITSRTKPTGGATMNYNLFPVNSTSEETLTVASFASLFNNIPIVTPFQQALVIRENEGMRVEQTTNSAVGSTTITAVFTLE
jgi:hypothetical protein